jgi:hypothetical protein
VIWRPALSISLGFLLLVTFASPAPPARADGIQVQSATSKNNFPNGVTFSLVASSNANITKVRLRFNISPTKITAFQNGQCNGDKTVTCTAAVGMTRGSYLNPKAQVVYAWELQDDAGNQFSTDEQTITYEDTRFGWQSSTDNGVTAFYYAGSNDRINSIVGAAHESVANINGLLKTQLDHPIKVIVYSNARDLQQALTPGSSQYTAGQVSSADTALTSLDQLGLSSGLDTIRHEVAHLVTGRASRDFIGGVPSWLNEGISVYSQRTFDAGWQDGLDAAIRQKKPLSIASMGESTRDGNATVNLFYGEAGSIVKFMIGAYGKDKFAEFFGNLKDSTMDVALQKAYGFDQLGLENAWRQSVGLPPSADTGAPAVQAGGPQSIPTIVPFGANVQPGAATPPAGNGQAGKASSSTSPLIYVIGVLAVILATTVIGTVIYLARGRST